MNPHEFLTQFYDFLAPKLDTYEQAIYLYVIRHSRLVGKDDVTIGIHSAAKNGVFGRRQNGQPMSPSNCRAKVRSLETKGCVKVVATEHRGSRIHALLPSEIPGAIPLPPEPAVVDLEKIDFVLVAENRALIFEREKHRCFYCLRGIDRANGVMEHVVKRTTGGNGYRNVVAACRQCNDRKGASSAEDFLRILYRGSILNAAEFEDRLSHLERLRAGELKPALS
jgi:hypothetical protein